MLLVGLVRGGDAEEQAACRVGLRLQRTGNSSIGWVMLWSTPDAQTSSTIAHTPAVFLSEKVCICQNRELYDTIL